MLHHTERGYRDQAPRNPRPVVTLPPPVSERVA